MTRSCARALEIFCSLLGNVAGNLALTLGASGGMYIGGGIVLRLGAYFASSAFPASRTRGAFARTSRRSLFISSLRRRQRLPERLAHWTTSTRGGDGLRRSLSLLQQRELQFTELAVQRGDAAGAEGRCI